MRQPVSTPPRSSGPRHSDERTVDGRIVGGVVLPAPPKHAQPRSGEDAHSVRMSTAAGAGARIDGSGPGRSVTGVIREGGERSSEAFVAGPAKGHATVLTGLIGYRGDAGFRGQVLGRGEPLTIVTDLSEDLRCVEPAGARKGREDGSVR